MKHRYFIALIPDNAIYSEIWTLKLQCTQKYQTQAALRSPPHITLLPPFHYDEKNAHLLYEYLTNVCSTTSSFQIHLSNFDVFKNRVVFIQAGRTESLEQLRKKIQQAFNQGSELQNDRPFHPHLTIGFRDWEQLVFEQAAKEYLTKNYQALWNVHHVSLLRHDGKKWQEIKRCFFNS